MFFFFISTLLSVCNIRFMFEKLNTLPCLFIKIYPYNIVYNKKYQLVYTRHYENVTKKNKS